ncbi:bacteriophage abortive infection AbiH family protein [Prevotella sp. E15-22]|uniref:AbiH family protein n=1 Tax=Prevotella sp. E15-22 TaxID=2937774 RepID=UPI00206CF049|nr:AbiH family protein [Prevotella sp. E15-22]UPS45240.1 bacteriophage abortive infection AbiH family protein [Prevotella sp. E15-22]
MNILYIIGNGLDIAHHMKTSYQDFFKYYLALPSDDYKIDSMKHDIKSHRYETWADLEIGLGQYSSHCINKGEFLRCLLDIKSNLKTYLQKESEKITGYSLKSTSSFLNLGSFLDPEPKSRYDYYVGRFASNKRLDVNIMTFNYTSTLEWLFDFSGGAKALAPNTWLESIQHVHGVLDNMMVMGVNDSDQIANTSFNTDEDVMEDFVKPEYNDACMNNKNKVCESLIRKADLIVLYGTSLGKSDEKWWKLIGQRMSLENNYPLLVFLPYDEKKDQAAEPNHLRRWVMQSVREIKEKFAIQLDDKVLASRICVAFNKRLFNISKDAQKTVMTR